MAVLVCLNLLFLPTAYAADNALLDVLLENGALTQEQYDSLIKQGQPSDADILSSTQQRAADSGPASPEVSLDEDVQEAIDDAVEQKIIAETPVKVSYGSKGFRLETRDGNFQTNLQWRGQLRFTDPFQSDPRQLDDFQESGNSSFEPRRVRMKIGGHGFKPWLKYYFEVDLQPARDVDADPQSSGARVIDWRADIARYEAATVRVGQWKIDLNRERVDSSGKQQFVERSIVNRIFTVDRQVGVQLRGRLFKETPADLNYYVGVFNGEGRSVRNVSDKNMFVGRLQWNFFGRELPWFQSDTDFTEKPTGSFAVAGFTNEGPCTRWSSSGCGNLDGFQSPVTADPNQYKIDQGVQELAFKYRGFSFQQEWHRKFIEDRINMQEFDLTGFYAQSGYFFHYLFDVVPEPLELAARYAYVQEPSETGGPGAGANPNIDNEREEYSVAANWFFDGHRNKLTLDYSRLTIDDGFTCLDDD